MPLRIAVLFGLAAAATATLCVMTHWGLALVSALVVGMLAIAGNELFLLLTVFLLPIGTSLELGGPLHDIPGAIRLVTVLGFLAAWGMRTKAGMRRLLRPVISRASLCFLAITMASIALTSPGWTSYSSREIFRLASCMTFFFFILGYAESRDRIEKLLKVLLYSTLITAGFAILQEIAGGYTSLWLSLYPPGDNFIEWSGRASSFLGYSIFLAGYLNLLLPFAIALSIQGNREWKRLGRWTCGAGIVALLCTQSLGGLAALVAIVGMAILRFAPNRKAKTALFAALAIVLVSTYVGRSILNPSHSEGAIGPDALTRLVIWSTAWDFFRSSPLLGIGWGNFAGLYGFYTSSISDLLPPGIHAAHNIYLQLLAETGVIGFVAFMYLLWKSWGLGKTLSASKCPLDVALAFGVQGAIASVLAHGFVDFLFHDAQFGSLFWGLLGLAVVSERIRRQEERGLTPQPAPRSI